MPQAEEAFQCRTAGDPLVHFIGLPERIGCIVAEKSLYASIDILNSIEACLDCLTGCNFAAHESLLEFCYRELMEHDQCRTGKRFTGSLEGVLLDNFRHLEQPVQLRRRIAHRFLVRK